MDVGRNFGGYYQGVKRLDGKILLIAFEKDMLIPWMETKKMAQLLIDEGKSVHFEHHPSIFGHDAFLKEYSWLSPKVKNFLHVDSK